MADLVNTRVIASGPRNYIARLTNISDGTGETLVDKVVIANLDVARGNAPTKTSIKEIQWSIQGFASVRLFWQHTVNDLIDVLAAGNGYREYGTLGFLSDPASAGGTGDILLTTNGGIAGATYDIVLYITLS